MKGKKYAVFFLIVFSVFLTGSSVLNLLEKTVDTAYFIDLEEEKKGESKTGENVPDFTLYIEYNYMLYGALSTFPDHFHSCDPYPEITLENTFPPPKFS